ncbi:MAG: hypothetical protein EPO67_17930 [Reyranella sp.]|nr:MAG: hypothetical protein EPO67_17930 [Reyranella sp.]
MTDPTPGAPAAPETPAVTPAAAPPAADPAAAAPPSSRPESLLALPAAEGADPAAARHVPEPAADAQPIAPDSMTYEPFTLPEGVAIDEASLAEAHQLFTEAKLPQEAAQKFVDLYTARVNALFQGQVEAAHKRNAEWVAEVKADPEVGGAKFTAARAAAQKALARFGSADLRKSLDDLWVGNNPALFRFFARVGQALNEDAWYGAPSQSAARGPTPAQTLYPDHNKE